MSTNEIEANHSSDFTIKSRKDTELKKIAADLYEGKIFTHTQIKNEQDILMVFMPIALGAFKNWPKENIDKIGLIYEYIDKAGPRSINGYPIFFSFSMINKTDAALVEKFYKKYEKLKKSFEAPANEPKPKNNE